MQFTVVASLAFAALASASPLVARQDDSNTLCGIDTIQTFGDEAACTAGCTGEYQQCYPHPNGSFECCGTPTCFPYIVFPGPDAEAECLSTCPGPCYFENDYWNCRHCEEISPPTAA